MFLNYVAKHIKIFSFFFIFYYQACNNPSQQDADKKIKHEPIHTDTSQSIFSSTLFARCRQPVIDSTFYWETLIRVSTHFLKRGHLLRIVLSPISNARILPYITLSNPGIIRNNRFEGAPSGELFMSSGLS